MRNVFLKLLYSALLFVVSFADTKLQYLYYFNGKKSERITGVNAQTQLSIPITGRWKIKEVTIHLEVIPSKALVGRRSVLTVYFNNIALYQQHLNPDVDVYSIDVKVPLYLLEDYNSLKIMAAQHYCMNCCENEVASELWTEILWSRSYIKIKYNEKNIKNNLSYLKDYVLDSKQYGPLNFGILLESKNDHFVTLGAKIAGFIGSSIKYRKIYINSVSNILKNEDIFLIGTKEFIRKILGSDSNLSSITVIPNPVFPSKSITILTADSEDKLDKVVNSFISLKKTTLLGKNLNIRNFKKPFIQPYDSPTIIPLDKKITFYDLGYNDFKFYNPSYFYNVNFNVSPDVYLYSKSKMTLHLAYNYGEGARDDSVINVFLNGKFLKQIKANKTYGTLLEEKDIEIPVYMLAPGKNVISVRYGLIATSPSGFCQMPNYYELQGTLFSKESYIKLPNLPHWREMAYLELFTTDIYPFSIYPDLKDTQIYISSKNKTLLSSLYTLMAYMGEKILVPFYSVTVVSDFGSLNKSKNIIAIGNNLPPQFYKHLPIQIAGNEVVLKYSIFKKIRNIIKSKILHLKDKSNLKVILSIKDKLTEEVVMSEGESPFRIGKTILVITSNNYKDIYNSIKKLYKPKFVSKIKGDFVVVDKLTKEVYHTKIGEKYYVGHLPLIEYLVYKLGFSFEWMIIYALLVLMGLVVVVKILLDFRERRLTKRSKK